jgi:dethiobiotin synthetase
MSTGLGVFVAGTDTGVGKTLVSCALLHCLHGQHARVVGMKPVAAGAQRTALGWDHDDVRALRAASSLRVPGELDNPYLLPEAISPHLAARRAGQLIDIALIVKRYRSLAALGDAVVVEGAGGFCVPLTDTHTGADLAQALGLPVVLVVALRLGCLSHALLTQEAIRARGLVLAGWVVNRIDPTMAAQEENVATLRSRLQAPLLGDIPWLKRPQADRLQLALPGELMRRQVPA